MNNPIRLRKGFTLIELLVVIAIIAILVAFVGANFLGARQRAKDIKKKSELVQMKNALRLYYNDYSTYPGPTSISSVTTINGCGNNTPPDEDCADTCANQFAAGGTGCENVYMKRLPTAADDFSWTYGSVASGENFCLTTTLENVSDSDLAKSQASCLVACGAPATDDVYMACAD
jgi:prepilin-type N-terminal cleavage/methylation domain-containing protein